MAREWQSQNQDLGYRRVRPDDDPVSVAVSKLMSQGKGGSVIVLSQSSPASRSRAKAVARNIESSKPRRKLPVVKLEDLIRGPL